MDSDTKVFSEILETCLTMSRRGFGIILDTARMTVRNVLSCESRGFVVTALFPFEIRDMGGHLWYFLLFQRDGNSVFALEPRIY
jgi:hypothetical protein